MVRIYFYKLTSDTGGAPCVQNGLLSLAICKPMIRKTAAMGDIIFGFAANSLHKDNRLIYAARITSTVRDGTYYKSARYAQRGDCIYGFRAYRFEWRPEALHHGPKHLVHDLGGYPEYLRAHVLLSEDFRYFGKDGSDEYKAKFPAVKRAVEELGQGYRVRHESKLRNELLDMKNWVWQIARNRKAGRPTSTPSRRVCHRARSCGVV